MGATRWCQNLPMLYNVYLPCVCCVQVYVAAATNTLLAGLSSSQLEPVLPPSTATTQLHAAAAAAAAAAALPGAALPAAMGAEQLGAMAGRALSLDPLYSLDTSFSGSRVLALCGVEHLLLLLLLAIQLMVPDTPEAVRTAAAARAAATARAHGLQATLTPVEAAQRSPRGGGGEAAGREAEPAAAPAGMAGAWEG